ncbi:MAG: TonB-dependent receptor, partial [Bacteroidia bacterium]
MRYFKYFLLILYILLAKNALAHNGKISGVLYQNSLTDYAPGVVVSIHSLQKHTVTDLNGYFEFTGLHNGDYELAFRGMGYVECTRKVRVENQGIAKVNLQILPALISLKEVTITSKVTGKENNQITNIDLQLRTVNCSQDLLRLVPGLIIAQHAGGGKAEQIFFRGFDVDHGTDFAIFVDGMPVNMVSHAHGQGYADLHFVIPETVKELDVSKGPYNAKYGDFATSGAGEFRTLNFLDKNRLQFEYGQFNTYRGLVMLNLLKKDQHLFSRQKESFYFASEYKYSDSYFESPQHFNRFNFLTKYQGLLSDRTTLTATASIFTSKWDASGQVPQRAVNDGTITRFGAIDDTEGGSTSRSNINLEMSNQLSPNSRIKNQLYYSKYDFDLYSNFTFFLHDSLNGDGIRQKDNRNILGYNGSYSTETKIFGGKLLTSTYGIGARYDVSDILLARSNKRLVHDTTVFGHLNQLNTYFYLEENLTLNDKINIVPSIRYDVFHFHFNDNLFDSASGTAIQARFSPKLNLYYIPVNGIQLFAKAGYGFHSNDARAVVVGKLENTLPRAFGYEAGATFKPLKKTVVNLALWNLDLESELIYVGDEGIVEASGRTRRTGIDFGIRQQIGKHFFADIDMNYNRGRLRDEPESANAIPLAPRFTSVGGIIYKREKGLNGSIRYRYVADRPANEANTVTAQG